MATLGSLDLGGASLFARLDAVTARSLKRREGASAPGPATSAPGPPPSTPASNAAAYSPPSLETLADSSLPAALQHVPTPRGGNLHSQWPSACESPVNVALAPAHGTSPLTKGAPGHASILADYFKRSSCETWEGTPEVREPLGTPAVEPREHPVGSAGDQPPVEHATPPPQPSDASLPRISQKPSVHPKLEALAASLLPPSMHVQPPPRLLHCTGQVCAGLSACTGLCRDPSTRHLAPHLSPSLHPLMPLPCSPSRECSHHATASCCRYVGQLQGACCHACCGHFYAPPSPPLPLFSSGCWFVA